MYESLQTRHLNILLLSLLAIAGCSKGEPVMMPAPNDRVDVPAVSLEGDSIDIRVLDYQGIQMLVESHRGKVVVVDYWSTDCPPCLKEFPKLVELDNKYTDDKVVCISVSLDYIGLAKKGPGEYKEDVRPYLEQFNATFDNIIAAEDTDTMLAKLELGSPPAVFVYDTSGKLAKRFDNANTSSEEEAFTYEDVNPIVAELVEPAMP